MWGFVNLTDLDINLPLDCKNIIWYLHTKIIMCKVVQPSILLFIFVQWIIPRIYTKIEKKYNPKIPLIKGIKRYAKRISFYICLRYEHKFVKWTGFIIAVNYAIFSMWNCKSIAVSKKYCTCNCNNLTVWVVSILRHIAP